jgi:hypothetical protein
LDVDIRSQMLLSYHLYKQKCFKPLPYPIRLFISGWHSFSKFTDQLCLRHDPNKFALYGSYVFDPRVRQIDSLVKKLYFSYLQLKGGDQDKSFAPHTACNTCVEGLLYWYDAKRKAMPFAIPMQWREQKNHCDDCYFCMANVTGYNKKNKIGIKYPNLYQPYGPFLVDLTYQYLVHLITGVANMKVVPCNHTLKKCISSHINMTDQ